jgi:hypothetical protein
MLVLIERKGKRMHGTTHGRADHRDLEGGREGVGDSRAVPAHGISEQTLYRWKAKYGGLESSDAKQLKALEEENQKLKHVVAELTLDNWALKDVLSKNWKGLRAGRRRRLTWPSNTR